MVIYLARIKRSKHDSFNLINLKNLIWKLRRQSEYFVHATWATFVNVSVVIVVYGLTQM